MGYNATQALYASLGYGAIQVVSTIPTLFLIDTKGRRTLTLIVSNFFNRYNREYYKADHFLRADLPAHVHLPTRRRTLSIEQDW